MSAPDQMLFPNRIAFHPQNAQEALRLTPARPAVFLLQGETGEPYLNQTQDLRRRLTRLLLPSAAQGRRLQLAAMVRTIAWAETASDFSAQWLLYRATRAAFGDRAARRLHLRSPFFARMGMRNRYPRVWTTQSLSPAARNDLFGPFPSRHTAERYVEQMLDLHLLRRCFQDLDPDPAFPGCIYSEMKKCLAPCYKGCSDRRYDEEAAAVHAFLRTRGVNRLTALAAERERASEALDFEAASDAHARYGKAEAVRAIASELAGALADQHAILVQPSAAQDEVALYRLHQGILTGPEPLSILGMRLPNEASGSSSLFAHPAAFAPIPLGAGASAASPAPPDERLRTALTALKAAHSAGSQHDLCEHQSLFARWYFRPQQKRVGELIAADPETREISNKALLRAAARVYVASLPVAALPGVALPGVALPGAVALPDAQPSATEEPDPAS
jgi:excinuclease ABC subunit C